MGRIGEVVGHAQHRRCKSRADLQFHPPSPVDGRFGLDATRDVFASIEIER